MGMTTVAFSIHEHIAEGRQEEIRVSDGSRRGRRNRDSEGSGWVGAGPHDDLEVRLAAEEENEPFDFLQPFIMTVLGPIHPAALGPALVVPSLSPDPAASVETGKIDDQLFLIATLKEWFGVGGQAIALVSSRLHGPAVATWIAARSSVHLVAPVSPENALSLTSDDAIGAVVAALVDDGSPSDRAGWIAIDRASSDIVAIVAGAQRHTGAAVVLDPASTDQFNAGHALTTAGVPPERLLLFMDQDGMLPGRFGRPADVLAAGFRVAFPCVPSETPEPRLRQAMVIAEMIGAGFGDRLVLALDDSMSTVNRAGYPIGPDLLSRFPLLLMEVGLSATCVRRLLVENVQDLLTMPGFGQESP